MITKGGQYFLAACKLFQAKALALILYGAQLGPFSNVVKLAHPI